MREEPARPLRRFLNARLRPSRVQGPVLRPPWSVHQPFGSARYKHDVPLRVLAPLNCFVFYLAEPHGARVRAYMSGNPSSLRTAGDWSPSADRGARTVIVRCAYVKITASRVRSLKCRVLYATRLVRDTEVPETVCIRIAVDRSSIARFMINEHVRAIPISIAPILTSRTRDAIVTWTEIVLPCRCRIATGRWIRGRITRDTLSPNAVVVGIVVYRTCVTRVVIDQDVRTVVPIPRAQILTNCTREAIVAGTDVVLEPRGRVTSGSRVGDWIPREA